MTQINKLPDVMIVGASISGLAAAAAIAPYCNSVCIYDKDKAPQNTEVRRYAPQGAHIHILLQAGLNILEELLPGIRQELISRGAAQINGGSGQQVFEFGSWRPTHSLDLTFLGQSRPFLEQAIYEQVVKISNVTIKQASVGSLYISDDGELRGIYLAGETSPLSADAVIDATGASGVFLKQLKQAMTTELAVETLPIGIFYSTLLFTKPLEYQGCNENILIVPEPGVCHYGGSLISIEDDKWCLSLHGRGNSKSPGNKQEWFELAENLADKRIWQRLQGAVTQHEPLTFKKATATWRRFDQCSDLPKRYFPIGDTINSLNPIFGQGMAVALGQAKALRTSFESFSLSLAEPDCQHLYFDGTRKWSEKVWKQGKAYERNFSTESEEGKTRIKLLQQLTRSQHQKAKESKEFYMKMIKDSQMLNHL